MQGCAGRGRQARAGAAQGHAASVREYAELGSNVVKCGKGPEAGNAGGGCKSAGGRRVAPLLAGQSQQGRVCGTAAVLWAVQ